MAESATTRWRTNFRRLLKEAGRSKSDVATKAGLSPQWATGVTKRGDTPSLDAVEAVARELSVDVAEFFVPTNKSDQAGSDPIGQYTAQGSSSTMHDHTDEEGSTNADSTTDRQRLFDVRAQLFHVHESIRGIMDSIPDRPATDRARPTQPRTQSLRRTHDRKPA